MATHFSILAWRIPWMDKSSRLQSMGSQGADLTERLHFHFHFPLGIVQSDTHIPAPPMLGWDRC